MRFSVRTLLLLMAFTGQTVVWIAPNVTDSMAQVSLLLVPVWLPVLLSNVSRPYLVRCLSGLSLAALLCLFLASHQQPTHRLDGRFLRLFFGASWCGGTVLLWWAWREFYALYGVRRRPR